MERPVAYPIPLIKSIPYVKDWLNYHPQRGNPNASLICGFGKSLGRRILPVAINRIYAIYKTTYFTKLLDSNIPMEECKCNEETSSQVNTVKTRTEYTCRYFC